MSIMDTTAVVVRPQQLEIVYTGCDKVALAKSSHYVRNSTGNPFTVWDLSCCVVPHPV